MEDKIEVIKTFDPMLLSEIQFAYKHESYSFSQLPFVQLALIPANVEHDWMLLNLIFPN